MDVQLRQGIVIPDAELTLRFTPSGGPGGQHANRSNTRVELTWDIETSAVLDPPTRRRLLKKLGSTVRIVVDDERSQARNRQLAHERLRETVDAALHRPRRRRPTAPTRASKRRRLQDKRRRSELKRQRRRPGSAE